MAFGIHKIAMKSSVSELFGPESWMWTLWDNESFPDDVSQRVHLNSHDARSPGATLQRAWDGAATAATSH